MYFWRFGVYFWRFSVYFRRFGVYSVCTKLPPCIILHNFVSQLRSHRYIAVFFDLLVQCVARIKILVFNNLKVAEKAAT